MKFMIPVLLPVSLVLAACATPREQCISSAGYEYASLTSAAAKTRQNISRGYAIHTQSVPYTYIGTCYVNNASYPCERSGYRTEETPVAIEISEERRKLTKFKKQLPKAQRRRDAAIKQCTQLHPE